MTVPETGSNGVPVTPNSVLLNLNIIMELSGTWCKKSELLKTF